MAVVLYGYRFSVYTRIARMALALKAVDYRTCEVNPFDPSPDPALTAVTPFRRVPVLDHDGFVVFETAAITRYVAGRFPGADLVPEDAGAAARMQQVIAIVDAHGYWPMVRQVFSHSVFRPLLGLASDPNEIATGLQDTRPVLSALENIAAEGLVLQPGGMTLADLHLAPMIGYLMMADQARTALAPCPALCIWWQAMSQHPAYTSTDPGLATLAAGA